MGLRRQARELAMKFLYESEFHEGDLDSLKDGFVRSENPDEEVQVFFDELLATYLKNQKEIDDLISSKSEHWKLNRMPAIDRNLLRLGIAELIHIEDIPRNVTINEYLEIAKKYGTEDSSGFINGILDKIE